MDIRAEVKKTHSDNTTHYLVVHTESNDVECGVNKYGTGNFTKEEADYICSCINERGKIMGVIDGLIKEIYNPETKVTEAEAHQRNILEELKKRTEVK